MAPIERLLRNLTGSTTEWAAEWSHEITTEWTLPGLTISRTQRLAVLVLAIAGVSGVVYLATSWWFQRGDGEEEERQVGPADRLRVGVRHLIRYMRPILSKKQPATPPPSVKKYGMTAFFASKKKTTVKQGYRRLDDEHIDGSSYDILLRWAPPKPEECSDVQQQQREAHLRLIRERLFAWPKEPEKAGEFHVLRVGTVRPNNHPTLKAKELRIQRLLSRLATRDKMNNRLRQGAAKDLQRVKGEALTPATNAEERARTMIYFDEGLQPLDSSQGEQIFENSKDEWINGQPQLFTSMERLHLIRLVLETPVEEGGCGIDLIQAQHEKWFSIRAHHTAHEPLERRSPSLRAPPIAAGARAMPCLTLSVPASLDARFLPVRTIRPIRCVASMRVLRADPVHDPNRTRLSRPKGQEGDEGPNGKERSADEAAVDSTGTMFGRMRASTVDAVKRTVHTLLQKLRNLDAQQAGTLIKAWHRAPLTFIPSQPLEEIRDYFGVEMALYFAFFEFFTKRLLIPGIIGIVPMGGWVYYGTMDNARVA